MLNFADRLTQGSAMGFFTSLKSLDELLYEVMS